MGKWEIGKVMHSQQRPPLVHRELGSWKVERGSQSYPKLEDQVALAVGKEPDAGNIRSMGIPGLGRSPGGGHGSPLQYSCLANPMDRGAWKATVHRVTKSWT